MERREHGPVWLGVIDELDQIRLGPTIRWDMRCARTSEVAPHVGVTQEDRPSAHPEASDAPVLTAQGVAKSYRRGWRREPHQVLAGAELTLYRGEIVGLVGENGSGKSTLMKILVGSLDRDGGQIERLGTFGYCPQEAAPPEWGMFLPARGAVRVLVDAAFTPTFDLVGDLALAFVWLVALVALTGALFRRIAEPKRA